MGRVFERPGEGHQFNQHYLDCMFPLQPAPTSSPTSPQKLKQNFVTKVKSWMSENKEKGGVGGSGFIGAKEEGNPFMDSILTLGHEGDEQSDEREGVEISYLGAHGEPLGKGEKAVLVRDMTPISPKTMRKFRGEFDVRGGGGFTTKVNGESNGANGVKETNGTGNGVKNGVMEQDGVVIERTEEDVGYGDVGDVEEIKEEQKMEFKVKDLSRLWMYVNGKSPKVDEIDVGLARMATI
jgi:hypothetical protein